MIKITIKDSALKDEVDYNFDLEAELTAPEEATATECLYMFIKALQVKGYLDSSINRAIKEIYEDICEGNSNGESRQA